MHYNELHAQAVNEELDALTRLKAMLDFAKAKRPKTKIRPTPQVPRKGKIKIVKKEVKK